jgi:hypothetical protein
MIVPFNINSLILFAKCMEKRKKYRTTLSSAEAETSKIESLKAVWPECGAATFSITTLGRMTLSRMGSMKQRVFCDT